MDDSSRCVTFTSERESIDAMCSSSSSASLGDHNAEDKLSTGPSSEVIDDESEFTEEEDEDCLSEEALLSQMGYTKSETKRTDEEEEEEDILDEAQMGDLKNEGAITTPTACLNLVSGLKGGREKEGMPHKECRVSWSPEVYDPPCTSDDHYTPNKKERHRTEVKAKANAGKNKQKSGGKGVVIEGSKGGGKSKDKKKSKKHGGKGSKYGEN